MQAEINKNHGSSNNGLIGLVACGGESKRMGTDKSLLVYHQLPQRYHVYQLIKPFCDKVFLSVNETQQHAVPAGYSSLADTEPFTGIGPMAAVLNAFFRFPGSDQLLIGCDYPHLTRLDINHLITYHTDNHSSCAFYHEESDLYEPLLSYLTSSDIHTIYDLYKTGQYSLQYFLQTSKAGKCIPSNKACIKSIDNPEESAAASRAIQIDS